MKSLYWRSNSVSTPQLVVVAVLAALGLFLLESNPNKERGPEFDSKLRAAQLTHRAFRAISVERIRRGLSIDTAIDPASTSLVGPPNTPIVSNQGHLSAKQTSVNPNFAAVFVDMLSEIGAKPGDVVAANFTGSFPALNIAMAAAFETLQLEPIVVSSVAASEFGATRPELTWPDMERVLYEEELISFRSKAITMGGILDVAQGHDDEGKESIRKAVERSGLPLMYPNGFDEAVRLRLDLFERLGEGRRVAAFVNVGGGTAAVGTVDDKGDFAPGINRELPPNLDHLSVMRSFLEQGVPVIHITHVRDLAAKHGLPDSPFELPEPGQGEIFRRVVISPYTIGVVIALILLALYVATRFDVYRTFIRKEEAPKPPEQMV